MKDVDSYIRIMNLFYFYWYGESFKQKEIKHERENRQRIA